MRLVKGPDPRLRSPSVRGAISEIGALLILVLACGERREDGRREDTGFAAARTLTAIEDVRIDGMAANLVPIASPPIRGLLIAGDGSIAASQSQDHTIRFFSKQGAPVASVGRSGEGPGEFGRIAAIGWLADSLWVFDAQLYRFTVIAPGGSYVRTLRGVQIAGGDASGRLAPAALYRDKTMLAVAFNDPERMQLVRVALDTGQMVKAVAVLLPLLIHISSARRQSRSSWTYSHRCRFSRCHPMARSLLS